MCESFRVLAWHLWVDQIVPSQGLMTWDPHILKFSAFVLVCLVWECRLFLTFLSPSSSSCRSVVSDSLQPVDCSPSGSSIHGILQARILEGVAISFSRGSSWPRDRTQVSHIAGRCFNLWATREAPFLLSLYNFSFKIWLSSMWF